MAYFFLCRKRQREVATEEPVVSKRAKWSLGPEEECRGRHVYSLPEDSEKAYRALISPSQHQSPSQLLSKIQLLHRVIDKAEAVAENSADDTGQPSPIDRAVSGLTAREMQEVERALQRPDYADFGSSGVLVKDALTVLEAANDAVVNAYSALITRCSSLPVTTSYLYELLRDMRQAQHYDVQKVEAALRLSAIPANPSRLGLPIGGKEGQWSCAVVCSDTETIHLFDWTEDEHHRETIAMLHWFVQNQFPDKSPFATSTEQLSERGGAQALGALRSMALGAKWEAVDCKYVLLLELKRGRLLPYASIC